MISFKWDLIIGKRFRWKTCIVNLHQPFCSVMRRFPVLLYNERGKSKISQNPWVSPSHLAWFEESSLATLGKNLGTIKGTIGLIVDEMRSIQANQNSVNITIRWWLILCAYESRGPFQINYWKSLYRFFLITPWYIDMTTWASCPIRGKVIIVRSLRTWIPSSLLPGRLDSKSVAGSN